MCDLTALKYLIQIIMRKKFRNPIFVRSFLASLKNPLTVNQIFKVSAALSNSILSKHKCLCKMLNTRRPSTHVQIKWTLEPLIFSKRITTTWGSWVRKQISASHVKMRFTIILLCQSERKSGTLKFKEQFVICVCVRGWNKYKRFLSCWIQRMVKYFIVYFLAI